MKINMKTLAVSFGVTAIVAIFSTTPAGASAPDGRYTYTTGSVTVRDTKTGLTWQRATPTALYAWADAKTYCASADVSTALGGTGWRLPTMRELMTLLDYSMATGARIDPAAFPGTPLSSFWSASLLAGFSTSAWYVDFSAGVPSTRANTLTFYVRCVR